MNKNTVCAVCGKHFSEHAGIFVVKPDEDKTYYLCTDCFNKKYEEDADFKAWWDNDTKVLDMDEDELNEEFGCGSLEALNECSYYTEFEDEGDEDE